MSGITGSAYNRTFSLIPAILLYQVSTVYASSSFGHTLAYSESCLRQWKNVIKFLIATGALCYLLWTYQHVVTHGVKFILSSAYRECAYRRRNYELEEKSAQQYVTTEYHGRLGNWMFSYAALLGIAKANGYIPYFRTSHPLGSYFVLSRVKPKMAECLYTVYDEKPCTYNPQFMNLPAGNITIDGYLQSWKYFRFIEKDIRKEFTFHGYIRQSAQREYNEILGKYLHEGRTVISIHVRRGDVLKPEARKLGFCHAPKSYFDNAMKYMLRKYPYAVFFVTSNELEWCKENLIPPALNEVFGKGKSLHQIKAQFGLKRGLTNKVPIVFSKGSSMTEDFAMLTFANHSILSVGTFGWWGAWLANGHVVYYDGFPIPGTKVDREMKKEDFFPADWVALSDGICHRSSVMFCVICIIGRLIFLHMR